jgi:hypothetical protein
MAVPNHFFAVFIWQNSSASTSSSGTAVRGYWAGSWCWSPCPGRTRHQLSTPRIQTSSSASTRWYGWQGKVTVWCFGCAQRRLRCVRVFVRNDDRNARNVSVTFHSALVSNTFSLNKRPFKCARTSAADTCPNLPSWRSRPVQDPLPVSTEMRMGALGVHMLLNGYRWVLGWTGVEAAAPSEGRDGCGGIRSCGPWHMFIWANHAYALGVLRTEDTRTRSNHTAGLEGRRRLEHQWRAHWQDLPWHGTPQTLPSQAQWM